MDVMGELLLDSFVFFEVDISLFQFFIVLGHILCNCVIFFRRVFIFLSKTLFVFFFWLFRIFFLRSFFNWLRLRFYFFFLWLRFLFFKFIDHFDLEAI